VGGARARGLLRLWFPALIALVYLYNFAYFKEIHSANELPRIYLTMAMVERGALNIDPEIRRYYNTPDTAGYKGRLYANKAPGMSLLAVPVYLVERWANGGQTPPLVRMFFWFRMFGSILPSLLFLWIFWRFLGQFVRNEGTRRLVLATYAVGSMALTYGTLFIAHQLSGALMATAYILLHWHAEGKGHRLTPLWAGLLAGLGVLVDYQVAFIGAPVFLYGLLRSRQKLRFFLLFSAGTLLPFTTLLYYQYLCFDNPLRTGYNYPTTALFKQWHSKGFIGLSYPSAVAFWGSIFRADNGLLYFAPYLALAFPGLVIMVRQGRHRADGWLCLWLVLFFVYFISSITFWRSGWAVGPRYITCALPYYMVPIAVLMDRLDRGHWALRVVPAGLMAVGMVIYTTTNAVFPHFPENFSNPWFDLTLRFGLAGYVTYNAGWLLGLKGLASVAPYLAAVALLLVATLAGGPHRGWRRGAVVAGSLGVMLLVMVAYHAQLAHRRLPVPVRFLPWMEQIWEPRHPGMDLKNLLPGGDARTGEAGGTSGIPGAGSSIIKVLEARHSRRPGERGWT